MFIGGLWLCVILSQIQDKGAKCNDKRSSNEHDVKIRFDPRWSIGIDFR
jgi:hypothetical protein